MLLSSRNRLRETCVNLTIEVAALGARKKLNDGYASGNWGVREKTEPRVDLGHR